MKILVVDEQDAAVGALARSLRMMTNHEVVTAVGGPRALELSQKDGAPDVLVTEVVLEGLDGFRLTEALREIRPELQTIYVTGYDMTEFADYLNGTPVFYKPADPSEIAALLPGAVIVRPVPAETGGVDAALAAGILLFNVESEPELDLLAARAAAAGKRARIALRVNPDVSAETHPYISTGLSAHKFGIGIALARAVYARAAAMPSIETAGVSVHIGSQIRQVGPFAEALGKTLALVRDLRADGHNIRYVDAGGGLGIEYGDGAFDAASQVGHYSEALHGALRQGGIDNLHLLLEPGRFLVGTGRRSADARALPQSKRRQALCHRRCRHERSHPSRPLPGTP